MKKILTIVAVVGSLTLGTTANAASTLDCSATVGMAVSCDFSIDATDQAALNGYPGSEGVYMGFGWSSCEPDPDTCGGMSSGSGEAWGAAEQMTGTLTFDATTYCEAPGDTYSWIWVRDFNSGAALSQGEVFVPFDCTPPEPDPVPGDVETTVHKLLVGIAPVACILMFLLGAYGWPFRKVRH